MSLLLALLLATLTLAVGFFLGRQLAPGKSEAGDLRNKLAAAEKALSDYRHDVNQHFQQTAHMVGRLTENYRGLYQHLAVGAQELCHDGQAHRLYSAELLGLNKNEPLTAEMPTPADAAIGHDHSEGYRSSGAAEAPRDYSPQSHGIMGNPPGNTAPERV